MSKSMITKLFVASITAGIAGLVLAFTAVWVAFASGSLVMNGADVVGVQATPLAWAAVALAIIGLLAIIGGFVGGLVSWIAALLNTSLLEDKTWFLVLLVLGVLSFGIVAMIAYIIGGPDGLAPPASRPVRAPA
jgi:hypothetical protein